MKKLRVAGTPEVTTTSDGRLTVSVPIHLKRRGGRKILTHSNGDVERNAAPTPTPLQRALARGHRWLALLESGEVQSLKDIAVSEGVCGSYVSRMVNLTLLAPDIVAAILVDALPNHITLFELAVDPPRLWEEQRTRIIRRRVYKPGKSESCPESLARSTRGQITGISRGTGEHLDVRKGIITGDGGPSPSLPPRKPMGWRGPLQC